MKNQLHPDEPHGSQGESLGERWVEALSLSHDSLELHLAKAIAVEANDFLVEWNLNGDPARCEMRRMNMREYLGMIASQEALATISRWLRKDRRMLLDFGETDWTSRHLSGPLRVELGGQTVEARAQVIPVKDGFFMALRLFSRFDPSQALSMVERVELESLSQKMPLHEPTGATALGVKRL